MLTMPYKQATVYEQPASWKHTEYTHMHAGFHDPRIDYCLPSVMSYA